ncbi:hypothetical protein EMIHUDRAFT_227462 [Emiliania huxleyi CCMP1516]|uniref:Uncharacterized protein n=2 Tax=Emiliania huxleyi TaxID=2903 RepID=A0A0D3KIT6_EMIH1|nr:hypothetical protein EMIHUDRAFT_227462 [Emiliania huxleyi CCMP1516]EOD35671.1 hypothetical protein EMIHUDRAFT_227462 [Emiliania huxleyi CCMP1516]|eukprot:XP_005788100.1 hypothetical protein EMIHUDRAFT_227462 [Emiliania huxleyi CCMP1516]
MLGYGRYFSLDVLILSVVALLAIQLIEKARVMWLTLRAAWTPPLVARLLTPAVAWHKCTDAELCAVDGAPPEARHAVESDGPYLVDADGRRTLDCSGSDGANVHGYNFYKACVAEGNDRIAKLGPNVSFHSSGAEAVTAAVQLCRFNTRRRLVLAFDAAADRGSLSELGGVLRCSSLDAAALRLLAARAAEVACVVVDPLQALERRGGGGAAGDGKADPDAAYKSWLQTLRDACTRSNVPLLLDEVDSGFRLAVGGAQRHFGVVADMVACREELEERVASPSLTRWLETQRIDPDDPARPALGSSTSAAAPSLLGPTAAFLEFVASPTAADKYQRGAALTAKWAAETNRKLAQSALPLRVEHLATVWTLRYPRASRYHWLLPHYLRAEASPESPRPPV